MSVSPTAELLQDAVSLHRRGAVAEAAARYAEVLRADPAHADAHYYLGLISCQSGRFAEGAELAHKALANDPEHARAHVLLGRALSALARHEEALPSFERAIALAPDLAQAYGSHGDALGELGRHAEAIDSYDRALALAPDAIEDWFNRGAALTVVGRHHDAISSFDRAIAGRPDFAQAHLGRAKALFDIGRYDNALEGFDKSLAIEPNLAEALLGRGDILTELKQYQEAFAAYDAAVVLDADLAAAWVGRGNALLKLKRFNESLAAHDKALTLNSDLAAAWLGRGNAFTELGRYDNALIAYDGALAIKSDLAQAWLGRGTVLTDLKRYDDAFTAYDTALRLKSDLNYAAGARVFSKLLICDWTNLDGEVAKLLAAIRQGRSSSVPFTTLAIPASAGDQLQCAKRYVQDQPAFAPLWHGEVYSHDRIRIAYLSADFREHPVPYLLAGMFERHDKSRFETTAISLAPGHNSPMRLRLKGAFEHFIDAEHMNDQDIAALVRRLEIDVAVDLMGFTKNNRLNVMARRPAPIQVNYMGYPGTMGANYIDYIIADPTVIPEDQCAFYSEQVVWVPESYFVNDNRRAISEHMPTRRDCALPDTGFVFCCFNNNYKIAPEIFDIWMRLLRATENSVLWLLEDNATASANLRREAERRGVSSERLIFAARASPADHLARLRLADLVLDTLPYNAHTTACDALWVGVPVLSCPGETFAGRVAASLLKAGGLEELIVHTPVEYEALAQKLAHEPSTLASLKHRVVANRERSALFDTQRSTRYFESAYSMMWERYQRGDMPKARPGGSMPIRIV
jgi:predicted O-linked N-acetylglucosamine transferase (SPINDLY family)